MVGEWLRRVRQNHGLEHATIHVLEERTPRLRAGGRATERGFYVLSEVADASAVRAAAEEALRRLRAGEHALAVHPRCGTNLVATSVLGGALALLGALAAGRRAPWYVQLPNAVLGAMVGALLAQSSVGPWLQANVTTTADVSDVRVRSVRSRQIDDLTLHFVETEPTTRSD